MSERAHTKGRLPFHMDQRAQAAVLADLPESVAQEAGEFYENHGGAKRGTLLKRDCMAHAWAHVLRPYLIGLRDWTTRQARPAPPWREIATAPEDEWILVATTGLWVGEAMVLDGEWKWASGHVFHSDIVAQKWMPLPEHPDAALSKASGEVDHG